MAVPLADKPTDAWQETIKPVVGLVLETRETEPLKLKVLFRVREIVSPDEPELKFTLPTATIVKSPTRTVTEARWDAVPGEPEPAIVTVYDPELEELTLLEAFAVVLFRLTGLDRHVIDTALGGFNGVRVTLPAKLLMLASDIETEEELPELKVTGPVIVMVKSPTFTVDEAECNAVPGDPEPEMVTTNVPRAPGLRLHLALAVPFIVRLTRADGHVTLNPDGGLTVDVTLMPPAKLFVLESKTEMKAPVAPELKLTGLVTVIAKSPT